MRKLLAGLIAVSLFGCGTDGLRPVGEGEAQEPASPELPGARSPGTPPGGAGRGDVATTPTELKLKGVDLGAYRAMNVRVGDAKVMVDGRPVDVSFSADFVDLAANANHAFTIGTFALPVDAERVQVELSFTDLGTFQSDAREGTVDLGVPPLQFEVPASYFAEHSHAVVHLNLARSLKSFEGEEQLLLLPDFQVHF